MTVPKQSICDDIDAIHRAIQAEIGTGQDVVLILHSDAAAVGLRALSKCLTAHSMSHNDHYPKPTHLIMVAACMPDPYAHLSPPYRAGDADVDSDDHKSPLFSDMLRYEAQQVVNALEPDVQYSSAHNDDPDAGLWMLIPCTYVACMRDGVLPPDYQTSVPTRYAMGLVEMASDHCPMVSHPDKFVDVVREIIE